MLCFFIAVHGTMDAALSMYLLSMGECYYIKTSRSSCLFLSLIIPVNIVTQNLYLGPLSLHEVCEILTRWLMIYLHS